MSDDELRVKVAELLGYKIGVMASRGFTGAVWFNKDGETCFVPNYPQDLNAMHEAEKFLLRQEPKRWLHYLDQLTEASNLDYEVHATARQRAEAFVAILSK